MRVLTGPARAAAGAIALICWVGLAVQFRASFEQNGSVADTLWIMIRYFTILANLAVAIVLTGIALGRPACARPSLLGGVTLAIILVGVTYGLLLRGLLELSGGAKLADLLLHQVTPVLVPLFWLFFVPKGGLRNRDPLLWTVFPIVYLGYALIRGAAENKYAYPFMDVDAIGWSRVMTNNLLIGAAFLVTGFALVWLDRLLARHMVKG